jgi:hypothetical protein
MKKYVVEANYFNNGSGITHSETIDNLSFEISAEEYIIGSWENDFDLRDLMNNGAADDIKVTIHDYDDEDPYAETTYTSEAWVSETLKDVA